MIVVLALVGRDRLGKQSLHCVLIDLGRLIAGIHTASSITGTLPSCASVILPIGLRCILEHFTWLRGHDRLYEWCIFLVLDLFQTCNDVLDRCTVYRRWFLVALLAMADMLIISTKPALSQTLVALGEGTVRHDVALFKGLRITSLNQLLGVLFCPVRR